MKFIYNTRKTPSNHATQGWICSVDIIYDDSSKYTLTWNRAFPTKKEAEQDAKTRALSLHTNQPYKLITHTKLTDEQMYNRHLTYDGMDMDIRTKEIRYFYT